MFTKKNDVPDVAPDKSINSTQISANITIAENRMTGIGDVTISGTFHGQILIEGFLIIAEFGKVVGDIQATSAHICGQVTGNVKVDEKVHIRPTGSLVGDLNCKSLLVDDGAVLDGVCHTSARNYPSNPTRPSLDLHDELGSVLASD